MDKELKVKWCEALRSGKYEQGFGALRTEGKLCCLGVLAEIASFKSQSATALITAERKYDVFGLDFETQNHFQRMNDGTGGEYKHSFAQIADYIEAKL